MTELMLKAIKHAEFASAETHCYSAALYLRGKPAAEMSNGGQGGPDLIDPIGTWQGREGELSVELRAALEASGWIAKWEADMREMGLPDYNAAGQSGLDLIEGWVCEEINKHLAGKRLKSEMSRCALVFHEGKLITLKYRDRAKPDQRLYDAAREKRPSAKILNEMAFAEALAIFRKAA